MRSPIAAMTLSVALASVPAWAQTPNPGPTTGTSAPRTPSPTGADRSPPPLPGEPKVYSATGALPGPADLDQLKTKPSLVLPDDPLDPYLLTKENGPFMIMAKVFRGPDAEKMALALCKELRTDFGLPAYILRTKDFPMRSYIRGTPPTAPSVTMKATIKEPERVRTHDEAAVLIGNEKTLAATEILLNKVKRLHPKCLKDMPLLFPWRQGLSHALRTTNPYIPAQHLYPKTPDKLVIQMNHGLRSIGHCPGHYSLQVAQFSGRTSYDLNAMGGQPSSPLLNLKESPLKTAHDDAERMADKLSRAPEIQRLGQPVFVYHDRTSSRVFIGTFNSPNDHAIVAMPQRVVEVCLVALQQAAQARCPRHHDRTGHGVDRRRGDQGRAPLKSTFRRTSAPSAHRSDDRIRDSRFPHCGRIRNLESRFRSVASGKIVERFGFLTAAGRPGAGLFSPASSLWKMVGRESRSVRVNRDDPIIDASPGILREAGSWCDDSS